MWGLDLVAGLALGMAAGSRGETPFLALLGGVLVASGGGVVRDYAFGLPFYVLQNPLFLAVALGGAWWGYVLRRLSFSQALLLDLAATLYFAWAGTERALAYGRSPEEAALAGTVTAVFGGALFSLVSLPLLKRGRRRAQGETENAPR